MKRLSKLILFTMLLSLLALFNYVYATEFDVSVSNGNTVCVVSDFSKDERLSVVLKRRGANNLFDFHSWCVTDKNGNTVFEELNNTDCFSPYIVFADDRAAGDNIYTFDFTGGNHDYSNSHSGKTPTARSESVHVYVDGNRLTDYSGKANTLEVKIMNLVQASNTKRENGYGREVLREQITICFDGKVWNVKTQVSALCNITIRRYYGYAFDAKAFGDNVEYLYTDKKSNNKFYNNYYSYSNGTDCRGMHLRGGKIDVVMRLHKNTDTDINNTSGYSAFYTDYGKMYFNIIYGNNPKKLLKGEKLEISGSYEFLKGQE